MLTVESMQRPEGVEIHIIDTGIGMSQEEVEKLGQPFFSTKDKGTGMG